MMTHQGLTLFTGEAAFPLPPEILETLLTCQDSLMENDDANARAMSMLVAEALHGHDAGSGYLVLKSKVFKSGRPDLILDP